MVDTLSCCRRFLPFKVTWRLGTMSTFRKSSFYIFHMILRLKIDSFPHSINWLNFVVEVHGVFCDI